MKSIGGVHRSSGTLSSFAFATYPNGRQPPFFHNTIMMISKAYLFLFVLLQHLTDPIPPQPQRFSIPVSTAISACMSGPDCTGQGIVHDFGITIFTSPGYRGEDRSFSAGTYYGGKHCSNYYDQAISFQVRAGYALWLYDKRGRILKKALGNVEHYNKGFHKFVVRKIRDSS